MMILTILEWIKLLYPSPLKNKAYQSVCCECNSLYTTISYTICRSISSFRYDLISVSVCHLKNGHCHQLWRPAHLSTCIILTRCYPEICKGWNEKGLNKEQMAEENAVFFIRHEHYWTDFDLPHDCWAKPQRLKGMNYTTKLQPHYVLHQKNMLPLCTSKFKFMAPFEHPP